MKNRGIVFLIEDFCEEWLDWASDGCLTSIGLHKIAVPGSDSIGELLTQIDTNLLKRIDKFENAGINVEYELHALEWLLPRSLFEDKPELFRVFDGKRTNDMNCCVSSSEALDIISERSYELAKRLKQKSHNYYFWTDDSHNSFCQCDKCKSLSASDQNMVLVNAMLRGVKAYDSMAKMAYLAYGSALEIPIVKPYKDVFLEFAPMDRDHDKPVNSADEARGQAYVKLLNDLLKIFDVKTTHILEYWLDNALFSGYKYPPVKVPFNQDVMEEDVKFYTSFGIDTVKSFGSYIGGEYLKLHGVPPIKEYGDILMTYERK